MGEKPREWATNSRHRQFQLGGKKVLEKERYGHLGIVSTIITEDSNRVGDRLSKARKALNIAAGIGVKRKGLNMRTCNVIFWGIVVPTALFGCEIWCLTANDINSIHDFQVYAGKRVQRLHPGSPNICSFTGLGWIHLKILILIRKVIFIRTIMVMGDDEVVKIILKKRAQKFCEDSNRAMRNERRSPVFEIMHAAVRLGMVEIVLECIEGRRLWSKGAWRDMTWRKGWVLNDRLNDQTLTQHKDMNLFAMVFDKVAYSVWWLIADQFPTYIYFCETMVKILSHSSNLKVDNVTLKAGPRSSRVCSECCMSQIDDARHMILQCDDTQNERNTMFTEIYEKMGEEADMVRGANDIVAILLGKDVAGLSDIGSFRLRIIAGAHIHMMYQRRTRTATGIG